MKKRMVLIIMVVCSFFAFNVDADKIQTGIYVKSDTQNYNKGDNISKKIYCSKNQNNGQATITIKNSSQKNLVKFIENGASSDGSTATLKCGEKFTIQILTDQKEIIVFHAQQTPNQYAEFVIYTNGVSHYQSSYNENYGMNIPPISQVGFDVENEYRQVYGTFSFSYKRFDVDNTLSISSSNSKVANFSLKILKYPALEGYSEEEDSYYLSSVNFNINNNVGGKTIIKICYKAPSPSNYTICASTYHMAKEVENSSDDENDVSISYTGGAMHLSQQYSDGFTVDTTPKTNAITLIPILGDVDNNITYASNDYVEVSTNGPNFTVKAKRNGQTELKLCLSTNKKKCVSVPIVIEEFFSEVNQSLTDAGTKVDADQNIEYADTKYTYSEINICQQKNVIDVMSIIGKAIVLLKILIPCILIIVSIKGLANCLIYDDKTDLNKFIKSFIVKFILSVVIFFLPTLVKVILEGTTKYDPTGDGYSNCIDCVLDTETCYNDTLYELKRDGDNDESGGKEYFVEATDEDMICGEDSLIGNMDDAESIGYYIKIALNVMKYAGMVLCVVFSTIDVIQALINKDDGAKDIVTKIIKRLIYACLLFFLPEIINIIFAITGLTTANCLF